MADEEALDRAVCQSMEEEISLKKEIPLSEAERIFTDYLQKLEKKVWVARLHAAWKKLRYRLEKSLGNNLEFISISIFLLATNHSQLSMISFLRGLVMPPEVEHEYPPRISSMPSCSPAFAIESL